MALLYISFKGVGADAGQLSQLDKKYDIMPKLTAEEKEYVFTKHPTDQQNVDASWKSEDLHIMLWALGLSIL